MKTAREQLQTVSWYIVLDLAHYLAQYLPAVWQVVIGQEPPSTLAGTAADALFTALENTTVSESLSNTLTIGSPLYTRDSVWPSLRQALQGIEAYGAALEGVTRPYDREHGSGSDTPNRPGLAYPSLSPG